MISQIKLNGYEFHYVENGLGDKVVLVHGSASDYRTWNSQLPEFGKYYHTIAYSRRFHRPNQKISEGEDYSMNQHLEDLEAFLKFLGNEPVHLVGHSYGAVLALTLACESPQYIRSLVLSEPPAITLFVSNTPKPGELLKLLFSRPRTALAMIKLGATGLGPAKTAAKKGDMETAMRIFGKAVLGEEHFNHMTAERIDQVRENLTAAEFIGSGLLPLDDQKLRNMKAPCLLLTAESSPAIFYHLASRLQELLPNAEQDQVAEASHIIHEDNVSGFNARVLSFLKKNDNQETNLS